MSINCIFNLRFQFYVKGSFKEIREKNFREHDNSKNSNRRTIVHNSNCCCCKNCIDKPQDFIDSEDMRTCHESKKLHRHLSISCWGKTGDEKPECALCSGGISY